MDKSKINTLLTEQNLKYFNIARHQTVAILGNGPSLNDVQSASLDGKFVISVNSYYKTALAAHVYPNAHVIIDPLYACTSLSEVRLLFEYLNKNPEGQILFSTPHIINAILKAGYRESTQHIGLLCYDIISESFHFNICQPLPPLNMNVLCGALTVSLFMGAVNIELFGFDHNFIDKQPSEDLAPDYLPHAYPEDASTVEMAKMYGPVSRAEHEANVKALLNQYSILKQLALLNGRNVVDRSREGKLNGIFSERKQGNTDLFVSDP